MHIAIMNGRGDPQCQQKYPKKRKRGPGPEWQHKPEDISSMDDTEDLKKGATKYSVYNYISVSCSNKLAKPIKHILTTTLALLYSFVVCWFQFLCSFYIQFQFDYIVSIQRPEIFGKQESKCWLSVFFTFETSW